MHGKGKFNFANGDIYVGDYFGGRQEGNGKFLWKSGDIYEGQVRNPRAPLTAAIIPRESDVQLQLPSC